MFTDTGIILYACVLGAFATGTLALYRWMTLQGGVSIFLLGFFSLLLVGGEMDLQEKSERYEELPGSRHLVDAKVEDLDLDPTHEEISQETDFTPVPIFIGSVVMLMDMGRPSLVDDHIPTKYCVLVSWGENRAWVPAEGLTYRRLHIGDAVHVVLRTETKVSMMTRDAPQIMAGPIQVE